MPTFQFHVEWLHLSVVILYTAGLIGTTNTTHIHWVINLCKICGFNQAKIGKFLNSTLYPWLHLSQSS